MISPLKTICSVITSICLKHLRKYQSLYGIPSTTRVWFHLTMSTSLDRRTDIKSVMRKVCEKLLSMVMTSSWPLTLMISSVHNVPEELACWYRVDSKTVGRYCNRCAYSLSREEWDLCNWKSPVDTEVKVASCINYSDRNQSSHRPIHKCTELNSEVQSLWGSTAEIPQSCT
jgi:hypothetical protein